MNLMKTNERMNYALHTGKSEGIHEEIISNNLKTIVNLPAEIVDRIVTWLSVSKDNKENNLSNMITEELKNSLRLVK